MELDRGVQAQRSGRRSRTFGKLRFCPRRRIAECGCEAEDWLRERREGADPDVGREAVGAPIGMPGSMIGSMKFTPASNSAVEAVPERAALKSPARSCV